MSIDPFLGRWKSVSMDKFDDYLKALNVNMVLRKAGEHSTTHYFLTVKDGVYSLKYKIAFKSGDVRFRLGEEVDEVSPDGRKVKTTFVMDGDTLVQTQVGKPMTTTLARTLEEDGDTMIEILSAGDVISRRVFQRMK